MGRGQAGDTSWLGKNGVGWGGCHATLGQGDLSHLLGPRRTEAPALEMEPSWESGLHNSRGHHHSQSAMWKYDEEGQQSEGSERNGRAVLMAHTSLGQSVRRLERERVKFHLHLHLHPSIQSFIFWTSGCVSIFS